MYLITVFCGMIYINFLKIIMLIYKGSSAPMGENKKSRKPKFPAFYWSTLFTYVTIKDNLILYKSLDSRLTCVTFTPGI